MVAEKLLEIGAIKLSPNNPFTWASGWNSPIYCDNRLSLSYPDVRTFIKNSLIELIRDRFPSVEVIAGVATAGIPQGAIIAEEMDLPFIYVRSKAKDHGLTNQIEGKVDVNQKVVVIEDLISTGGSSIKAIKALREENVNVLGMVSIFSYDFQQARENLRAENIEAHSLSTYKNLLPQAIKFNYLKQNELEHLENWSKDPENWKPIIS